MKKLFKLLTSVLVISTSSLTLVSCFPKEVQVYYSEMGYEILSNSETDRQIPLMKKRIASFNNDWMRKNIYNGLYFNIKEDEQKDMIVGSKLNERQKEIMVDTISANLRVYKILDTDFTLNPNLFETTWTKVEGNKFAVDLFYNDEKFVEMSGEFFVDDTEEISEINENTFIKIADMAKMNDKIVTSTSINWIGSFWGAEFIGEKYTEQEQVEMWSTGKYSQYEFQDKQTMTWKGEQKIDFNALKQTMTDYLSSRLRTSGTIQSNLEIDYNDVGISTTRFASSGSMGSFICKADAKDCVSYSNEVASTNNLHGGYYYFDENMDFGAATMIQQPAPRIWYKTNPEHQIEQGGSIFQSHVEYKW